MPIVIGSAAALWLPKLLPRHRERSAAIHIGGRAKMDCRATLAMTGCRARNDGP